MTFSPVRGRWSATTIEKVPLALRRLQSTPWTACGSLPGMETWGWLMASMIATTWSRVAGTNWMVGSGVNTLPSLWFPAPAVRPRPGSSSASFEDELLHLVVHLGRGAGHHRQGIVDHDMIAPDV